MTQSELIKLLHQKLKHKSNKEIENQVREFFSTIKAAISNGYTVEIRGFGRFSTKNRNPRKIINPRTKKEMLVNARKIPHFKPGKIKEEINQN
jgi:integration host factor subunit beta